MKLSAQRQGGSLGASHGGGEGGGAPQRRGIGGRRMGECKGNKAGGGCATNDWTGGPFSTRPRFFFGGGGKGSSLRGRNRLLTGPARGDPPPRAHVVIHFGRWGWGGGAGRRLWGWLPASCWEMVWAPRGLVAGMLLIPWTFLKSVSPGLANLKVALRIVRKTNEFPHWCNPTQVKSGLW